jgi:CHASE3 domain sensor protein
VELNRQVYRTLHHIATLNNLHIRLQAGPSLYETPPPLPFVQPPSPSSVSTPTVTYLADASIPGGPPPPPPAFNIPAPASLFYTPNVIPSLPPPAPPKPPIRAKPHKKASTANEPPTLSGFRNLKRVAILDIDSLDMVAEVKACVKNSASTLTKLKLSFSDCLGAQARKPAPEVDPDASDLEDDFQPAPPTSTNPYADDATGPGKVFRAQEERKAQEMVLGRIFDVEQTALKKPLRKSREKDRDSVSEEVISNAGKAFIHALKVVSTKLAKDLNGTAEPSVIKQEILDVIEAAARKYVASEEKLSVTEDKASDDSSSTVKASPSSENEQQQEATPDLPASQKNEGESPGTPTNVETSKEKISSTDLTPEDISIEEPEEQLVVESQEGSTKDTPISTPANEPEASTEQHVVPASAISEALESNADKPTALPIGTADFLAGQVSVLRGLSEDLLSWQRRIDELDRELLQLRDEPLHGERDQQILAADQQMENVRQHVDEIREKIRAMQAQWDKQGIELPRALANESEALTKRASAYARSTRGLALQSLSIYLMPVKASVLSRAIDLRALRRLTLLNVGPQAPIWALLTKENKVQPLPLRKIFTDNVSIVFLNFVSQMEEIHELFMLERDAKYKPQSFAPPTATNIEQIRRLVLRKHLPRLQRLMIKNQSTNSWDFDQKTMLMVCRRGTELQELAISMGIRTMVRTLFALFFLCRDWSLTHVSHSTCSCRTSLGWSSCARCT